ncbi:hypothetical protein [Mycoplasma phocimorsus]|uniref:hypothetical protein n=1 Tax=Mycoplasma phocimorsus TaxID=3045839 RepID=UPI0024BF5AE2|nr:hypothetical protein [Mycoplasma phocimorsus]MDJ1648036.1 hypothetical protein [Mycoplasma phocimorsus]
MELNKTFKLANKITKKQHENIMKLYENHEYILIYDENDVQHTLVSYNTFKEISSVGANVNRKEFEEFKKDLLKAIKDSEISRKTDKLEAEKQRQEDKAEMNQNLISFKNEILEIRRLDKLEAEKQRQEDEAEMNQNLILFKNEILEMRRLDKLEAEKQRQKDKAEMNQNLISFKNEILEMRRLDKLEAEKQRQEDKAEILALIKTNHVEITNRLDRIESDVEMLKSFHIEDIKKYHKQNK